MDEEVASAPHVPLPQGEPQAPPEFQVLPIPQPGFFPPMTSEAFQTYTNFWYAQAQTQAQVGQGQYPMPPMATFPQSQAQLVVKLSKLVKKAR